MTRHREHVFRAAEKIVDGSRQEAYGPATRNFADMAALATAILRPILRPGERVTSEQVSRLMIAVKLSRITHSPTKDDHWIDIIGYAALGYEVAVEEEHGRAEAHEETEAPQGPEQEVAAIPGPEGEHPLR